MAVTPIPLELEDNLSTEAIQAAIGVQTIYAYTAENHNKYIVYLKFYDKLAANVNPNTDAPLYTLTIPAAVATGPGRLTNDSVGLTFSTAISIRATVNNYDADTISPATSPVVAFMLDQVIGGSSGDPTMGGDITGTASAATIASGAVTDAKISAGASIAWSKINKSGSSLSELTTRSATDLTSGTLPNARLSSVPYSALVLTGLVNTADIASTNKDGLATTPSMRTLGTGALQAAAGNDSRLSDSRTPSTHANTHKTGGTDSIKLDELAATTDVTTLNASTTAHGLLPKLSGSSTQFLSGTGAFAVPPGGAPSGSAGGALTGTYPNPSLASSVAGNGLLFSSNAVAVNTDGATLEVASNAVKVKALGITDTHVAAANKDGTSGTASMRTLGTGATQACGGDDARLTDSRPPTGAAAGDLGGTYPSPTVANVADFSLVGGQLTDAQLPPDTFLNDPGVGGFVAFDESAGKAILLTTISPTTLGADQNDYNPTGLSYQDSNNQGAFTIRIDGGAANRILTGLAGGYSGRVVRLVNVSANTGRKITLADSNTSSAAGNRFSLGADLVLGWRDAATLVYNTTWTLLCTGYNKLISDTDTALAANSDLNVATQKATKAYVDGKIGGDFSSNTSSSVDSELVLFSGTAGKTGKRATGSGMATLSSGVLSTVSPGTSGNVATSDGTNWTSAAPVAGSVYPAATPPTLASAGWFIISSTSTTIDLKNAGTTTIWTVPTGRTYVLSSMWAVVGSVTAGGTGGVGMQAKNGTGNKALTPNTGSGTSTPVVGTTYVQIAGTTNGPYSTCVAGDAVNLVMSTSNAGSTAVTGQVFMLGFYIS